MPAIIDDPSSPTIYRVSGEPPFPDPNKPALPANIKPRQVTLRDKQTVATVVPFISRDQVPKSLLLYLADQFAKEIIKGDTYPMLEPMPSDKFASYWFQNFGAIMLLGDIERPEDVVEGKDWSKECLGSFYIKPNYPGRSSHICNAGFLVTDASRNRGVGRLMGEAYLDWAPKLGYTYSVFNLVYETNVASCRIWDALGFKRIGRVPKCGNLKSYPGRLVDAIIYGRDLSAGENDQEGAASAADELVSQERFEKIKFYLKHGKYPDGADRAEKSRLRSSAIHYTLVSDGQDDVLMFNNKECIADSGRQYEIARKVHAHQQQHGGINKTTAAIAEKYHWSRIKDTVSDVIRACTECNEVKDKDTSNKVSSAATLVKPPTVNSENNPVTRPTLSLISAPQADSHRTCEDGANVGPAVADTSAFSPLPSNRQGITGENADDVLGFYHNDHTRSAEPVLPPSAGLDMGHNYDPDLSAIYQFLLAPPTSPQQQQQHSFATARHHDYLPPIDPRLANHGAAYGSGSNNTPLLPSFNNVVPNSEEADLVVHDDDFRRQLPSSSPSATFFVDHQQQQKAGREDRENTTSMEIDDDDDDNRRFQGHNMTSHDPSYPELYDTTLLNDESVHYHRSTIHRPSDGSD